MARLARRALGGGAQAQARASLPSCRLARWLLSALPCFSACRFELCAHPWALLVAFSASLVALLRGFDAIAVGNERSASEGNAPYCGAAVNHQHDKALPFELECARYVRRRVAPRLRYFSPLAHLWDVQVAKRFARADIASRMIGT